MRISIFIFCFSLLLLSCKEDCELINTNECGEHTELMGISRERCECDCHNYARRFMHNDEMYCLYNVDAEQTFITDDHSQLDNACESFYLVYLDLLV
jgi:hypothetical protein